MCLFADVCSQVLSESITENTALYESTICFSKQLIYNYYKWDTKNIKGNYCTKLYHCQYLDIY